MTQTNALTNYNFIIVADASGSMNTIDAGHTKSHWEETKELTIDFANELASLDSDGIDIVTFGGTNITSHVQVKAADIHSIFERRVTGGTPLAEALEEAFKLAGKSDKPDFIAVFTNGAPDDAGRVKKLIIDKANSLENDADLTILFIQVGNDAGATAFLKELDGGLNAKFDIVDTITSDDVEAAVKAAVEVVTK